MPKTSVQATQIEYNLHTLGWKAFQDLCSTIISEVWGQTAQIFSDTNDGGRDGAFYGKWVRIKEEVEFQDFVVQCKFSKISGKSLNSSDLSDELSKVEKLAKKGLCRSYLIVTNAKVSAKKEEIIRRKFESINGVNHCRIYGKDWVTAKINENSRLRMLVPQVYGLGDLSQILDQRAYEQSSEILSSLGGDIKKFVVTKAHQKSAKAILAHGFVLLLGDPASGKSTIAAALAMAALDEWGCSTIKVVHPSDFQRHFNPHEKQFFWIDDAFGATQYEQSLALEWNRTFPHLNAAIKNGAKVIFTSRNYIYKAAKKDLKDSSLPVAKESQVVIDVEDLSLTERRQMLYNHLKHGNQPTSFKRSIKYFLPSIADNKKFSPEVARRVSNSLFTKKLRLESNSIKEFVEKPLVFLKEVIETIGDSHRAALSLIFMRGGSLESPVKMTPEEERSINLLSSNTPKITSSYNALEESLVLKECSDGNVYWKFKHPTIRDALASIISEDQELLDIYLSGAKPEELFTEITCGVDSIRGVSLIVPKSHFDKILSILEAYLERYKNCAFLLEFNLNPFLSNRCNFDFLKIFIDKFSYYPDLLTNFSSLEYDSKVNLLMKLSGFSLLDESTRKKAAEQIQKLVVEEAVPGFPNNFTELILRMDEHSAIVEKIKTRLLPNLTDIITETANSFDKDEDANDHFYDLIKAIGSYRDLLGINEDCDESSPEYLFKTYIDNALVLIDETVDELNQEPEIDEEREWLDSNSDSTEEPERSIFDDVDI